MTMAAVLFVTVSKKREKKKTRTGGKKTGEKGVKLACSQQNEPEYAPVVG